MAKDIMIAYKLATPFLRALYIKLFDCCNVFK